MSQRAWVGLALLVITGILTNYFRWNLFFNIEFLFGSIVVLMVICLYGTVWGTLAGFLAGSVTYSIWQHPYAMVILTCEALVVGWLFHRQRHPNLVLMDALFWLVLGMPLVALFYGVVLQVDSSQLQIVLTKQSINGIFNALIASLCLTVVPIHRWVDRPAPINSLSLQQAVFNLLVAFVTIPTLILMVLASHQVMDDIKTAVRSDLSEASRFLSVEVEKWYDRRLMVINELAKTAALEAPEITRFSSNARFAQRIFPSFHHLHLIDPGGQQIFDEKQSSHQLTDPETSRRYLEKFGRSARPFLSTLLPIETEPLNGQSVTLRAIFGVPVLQGSEVRGAVLAELDFGELVALLKANTSSPDLKITLVDEQGTVAASTQADRIGTQKFNWRHSGDVTPIGTDMYHWLPIQRNRPTMERWLNSFFVKESSLQWGTTWTMVIEIAATPHVRQIQQVHTKNLLILLLVIGAAQLFAVLVSRKLVNPLSQLAQVTTNLPNKLLEQEPIDWQHTRVTEFRVLIQNFQSMATSLQQKFLEIQQAKTTLERRVQERTQTLQKMNLELAAEIAERTQVEIALRESESRSRQMAERERLLGEISRQMRQSLDLDRILNTTVAEVRQFLQVDRVIIYQFQPDWSGIVVVESIAAGNLSILGRRIMDTYFAETRGEDYIQGRIQVTEDVATSGLAECHLKLLAELKVQANLVVPILQSQSLWGLLVAQHCSSPRAWHPSEIDFLKQLSTQAAVAIQQSELYQHEQQLKTFLELQVEERTAQLQKALSYEAMLKRITDKVRDSLDEKQILQAAVEELAGGVEIEGCDTLLFDLGDGHQPTFGLSHVYQAGRIALSLRVEAGPHFTDIYAQLLTGQFLQLCELIPDLNPGDQISKTILICPITDDQGTIGCLRLFRAASEIFSEAEIRMVLQVANQCAIALRQARLYEAAQLQVKVLEELNQLKDDFLSTVSHELRTPIANMKMAIHMLQLSQDAERQHRYLAILQSECAREASLINDLLDLQRLASGTKTLELEQIMLQEWLDQIIEPFQSRVQNRQQILHISLPPVLPQLVSDRACLTRIVAELLNNACKYTPPGERIMIELCATQAPFQVRVTNTGVEIPIAEQARIFEKFYRIPGVDRWKQGGTGLGLTLVQQLANHLGGTITLESSNNQVSFTLTLPGLV